MGTCERCNRECDEAWCERCIAITRQPGRGVASSAFGIANYLAMMGNQEWKKKAARLANLARRERVPWDSVFREEGQP